MLYNLMREVLGQVTFAVAVSVVAFGEEVIADKANMLALHANVLTFKLLVALVAPAVAVVIVTIAHLLITFITVVLGYVLMSTVDDSVATVAIVILVIIIVIANELLTALVTMTVIIIIVAICRHPDVAMIADVITVIISVIGIVGIRSARCLLSAKITASIFVLVDMIKADQFATTDIAGPISVLVRANIRHPLAALVTIVVAVLVGMSHIALHTVCRAVTFVASSVAVSGTAIICHTNTAIIAGVIVIFVAVQIVIICTIEHLLTASVAQCVCVSVNVTGTRHCVFAHVTNFVAIFIYARNRVAALVAPAVPVSVSTQFIKARIADDAFVSLKADSAHKGHPDLTIVADMVFVIVRVFSSGYGTKGGAITYVTHAILVVVEAKIPKMNEADIADVVVVSINVSVLLAHGMATIIAMSVIVFVDAIKIFPALVAHIVAVCALMDTVPYDIALDLILRHSLIE